MASRLISAFALVLVLAWTRLASAEHTFAGSRPLRAATGNRKLQSPNATIKTIFNDGWAPGCSWVADGAFNISIVPGTGEGQSSGLCTTFPGSGGWMSFSCSGSDLSSALSQVSAADYFISQLQNSNIGAATSTATVPTDLQLFLQDDDDNFLCKQSLGTGSDSSNNGITASNGLVQTSNKFDDPTGKQDCSSVLQIATKLGFLSLAGGITFCVDAVQLV